MKRAMLMVKVTDELIAENPDSFDWFPTPPSSPWYIRGPRGGLYAATGMVQRVGPAIEGDDWMFGQQSVAYHSEGLRYLRPQTREWRDAVEWLGGAIE